MFGNDTFFRHIGLYTKFVNDVLDAMKEVKWRAKFDILFGRYLSQVDLLFSENDVQQVHWIRAKRLGYLVYRIGYFFHDKSMDLKFASRKVRQLIDKYVQSSGIDTKFSQMKLMSEDFVKIKNHRRLLWNMLYDIILR